MRINCNCGTQIEFFLWLPFQIAALEDTVKKLEEETKDLQSQEEQVQSSSHHLFHLLSVCRVGLLFMRRYIRLSPGTDDSESVHHEQRQTAEKTGNS